MVPTLSLSLACSLSIVIHIRTYARERKRKWRSKTIRCVCMYVHVACNSNQTVYMFCSSLILVRANTNRRRLSAMYKPFIILAPVQQQLNAFFFFLSFLFFLYWTKVITKKSMLTGLLHIHALIYEERWSMASVVQIASPFCFFFLSFFNSRLVLPGIVWWICDWGWWRWFGFRSDVCWWSIVSSMAACSCTAKFDSVCCCCDCCCCCCCCWRVSIDDGSTKRIIKMKIR